MRRDPPKGWKLYVRGDGLTAPAVVVGKIASTCWPHVLTLSPKTYAAHCTICDREFTAWEALLYLTRHWPLLKENLEKLQADMVRLEAEKVALRREVTNLRATKRRLLKGTAS